MSIIIIASIIYLNLISSLTDGLHLNGVTLKPDHPRSDVYLSFFHELISDISNVAQFSYQLRIMPEGIYGGEIGEIQPQGLIGEIYDNNADFLIADMEITPERSKFVQFTTPYMRSQLAGLVKKTHKNNAEDLQLDHLRGKNLLVINDSKVERYFRTSKNPLIYHLLPKSVSVIFLKPFFCSILIPELSKNITTGIDLVKSNQNYVLLSDSARLELVANVYCDLQVLKSKSSESFGSDFQADYAIAVSLKSPFFGHFESAIKLLDETGNLEALIEQHWYNQCDPPTDEIEPAHRHGFSNNQNVMDSARMSAMSIINSLFLSLISTMICFMLIYYSIH